MHKPAKVPPPSHVLPPGPTLQNLTPKEHDRAKRQAVVDTLNEALSDMGLEVRPFGSFLSDMGFPDSDVDLLLAGEYRGMAPYLLPESGRKTLLRKVASRLYQRGAVRGSVSNEQQHCLHVIGIACMRAAPAACGSCLTPGCSI